MDHKTKGNQGEAIAKSSYESKGFEILEENYRYLRAEVDLIAIQDERLLVFIEVKMRAKTDYGTPESFVSESQRERIRLAAEDYVYAINWKKDIRFDIVCVDGNGNIEIFEDAF